MNATNVLPDNERENAACSRPLDTTPRQLNWTDLETDFNLEVVLTGGVDNQGLYWPSSSHDLQVQIETALLDDSSFQCTLKFPCTDKVDCNKMGT